MTSRLKKLLSRRFVFRSAVTGRYVSRLYALAHPRTTYATEIVPPKDPAKLAQQYKNER